MNPQRRALPSAALRLLLAWAAVSAVCAVAGEQLVAAMLPLLSLVTESASEHYTTSLRLTETDVATLEMRAAFSGLEQSLRPLGVSFGTVVTASTNVAHVLVPVVILMTGVLAWPAAGWRQRAVLLTAALPAAVLAVALTTPFLLAGKVEIALQNAAAQARVARDAPFVLDWMLFTEAGGRWLVPLVLGCVCIALAGALVPARSGTSAPA
ncbi:MAG: hypothetical protein ACU85V_17020 [Gammaproteobacteria bacterium]